MATPHFRFHPSASAVLIFAARTTASPPLEWPMIPTFAKSRCPWNRPGAEFSCAMMLRCSKSARARVSIIVLGGAYTLMAMKPCPARWSSR
jgi:hypothetical protein